MEFDKDPGCFVNGCSPVESWFGVLEQADKAWPGKARWIASSFCQSARSDLRMASQSAM